jgi:hypothetical protein
MMKLRLALFACEERFDIHGPMRFSRYDIHQVFAYGTECTNYLNTCAESGANFGASDQTAEDQAKIDVSDFLTAVFNF